MKEILIAVNEKKQFVQLNLAMANRHGLIAGATGTGKTVTLQRLAEQFSFAGIPVFTADVKGDLIGLSQPSTNGRIKKIATQLNVSHYTPRACPVVLWDLYGKKGNSLRTTINEVGPLLLGRILDANNIQQGVINAAFSLADDNHWLLLDINDFRTLLEWMSNNSEKIKSKYGNISKSTVGALQRNLLSLSEAGGELFFGEPALKLEHIMQQDPTGKGVINILDATQLINDPRLYSTFLLWLLSELFEKLPEVGDVAEPKLVFFFDEAHLLFKSAPKILLDKIEQLVRLIRSKGVGVYFITQNPMDVPDTILGQLGNKVQHAMRAFTPKDQKAVKTIAETFRATKNLDVAKSILELAVGEALVSFLDASGTPTPVAEVRIIPPESKIGTISEAEYSTLVNNSPLHAFYAQKIDRQSAHEILQQKMLQTADEKPLEKKSRTTARTRSRQSAAEAFIKSTARSVGNQFGKQLIRALLGSLFGKK